MITKYLVEAVTGLYVGEAINSPSLGKVQALNKVRDDRRKKKGKGGGEEEDGETGFYGRGQGEVVAVRTQFPHTSGKLVS